VLIRVCCIMRERRTGVCEARRREASRPPSGQGWLDFGLACGEKAERARKMCDWLCDLLPGCLRN